MIILTYPRNNSQSFPSFGMPTAARIDRKATLVQFGLAYLTRGDSTVAALFTIALRQEGLGDG